MLFRSRERERGRDTEREQRARALVPTQHPSPVKEAWIWGYEIRKGPRVCLEPGGEGMSAGWDEGDCKEEGTVIREME